MKTVLVTGGCGFIGSHFVHLLLQAGGWRVVNLDRLTYAGDPARLAEVEGDPRYRMVIGDIADREAVDALLADERPWALVNFAAESHVDRSILDATPFLRTNVQGVQVLLEAARRHGTERILQISTDEVYGDAEGKEPFLEASALCPSNPYSASKAAGDLLCLAYHRTYGLPVVIARSSNNYGPFQFPEKLMPLMIHNALSGNDLPVYGDGGQIRDWLFVEDNCRALLAVLEHGRIGAVYNIAVGEARTNLEVVRLLCRVLAEEAGESADGFLARIRSVADRPGHDRRYSVDTSRIRDELDWEPAVPFEEGVRRTVHWYLFHREWVERVASGEYRAYYEAVYGRRWGLTPP